MVKLFAKSLRGCLHSQQADCWRSPSITKEQYQNAKQTIRAKQSSYRNSRALPNDTSVYQTIPPAQTKSVKYYPRPPSNSEALLTARPERREGRPPPSTSKKTERIKTHYNMRKVHIKKYDRTFSYTVVSFGISSYPLVSTRISWYTFV